MEYLLIMKQTIVLLFLLFISTSAMAIFCPVPENFKTIQQGDTLQAVLDACGPPIKQKTFDKVVQLSISAPLNNRVTTGTATGYGGVVVYNSSTTEPTYVSGQKEIHTEITEMLYPRGVLQFENGILVHAWEK